MGAQPERSNRVVPIWTRREKEHVMSTLADHKVAIEQLKANDQEIADIAAIVKKIWRAVKVGGPTIIAFLVGGGYVGQDVANALKAVLGM